MTLKVIIVDFECCCNDYYFILPLIVPKKRHDKIKFNIIYYYLLAGLFKDSNFLHLRDGFCEVAVCKKIVSDSSGLVDFAIRLGNSILHLPEGK